jgi:hypothetical protein
MVVEVVASSQRRYETRVLPMVEAFARTPSATSTLAVATNLRHTHVGLCIQAHMNLKTIQTRHRTLLYPG